MFSENLDQTNEIEYDYYVRKGYVKEIIVEYTRYVYTTGEIDESRLYWPKTYIFNEKGNLIRQSTISDGIQYSLNYEYNENNLLTAYYEIWEDNLIMKPRIEFEYVYNENEIIINYHLAESMQNFETEVQIFDNDGRVIEKRNSQFQQLYTYTIADSKITVVRLGDIKGVKTKRVFEYFYDGNNRLIEYAIFRKDGKEIYRQQLEYDEFNYISTTMTFDNSEYSSSIRYEYDFDETGNWIEKRLYSRRTGNDSFQLIQVCKRIILYINS